MKTIDCYFDYAALLVEAEGQAWNGWFCPIWAKLEKDCVGDDCITLSLGGAVSRNTSFIGEDGGTPVSWVGGIACWERTWKEGDAEDWAEECMCKPEDFDSEEEMKNEAEMKEEHADDEIEAIKEEIRAFAKAKGFDDVEFL